MIGGCLEGVLSGCFLGLVWVSVFNPLKVTPSRAALRFLMVFVVGLVWLGVIFSPGVKNC